MNFILNFKLYLRRLNKQQLDKCQEIIAMEVARRDSSSNNGKVVEK